MSSAGLSVGITFALPAESSDFVKLLTKRELFSSGGIDIIRGQLHEKTIVVLHTGVGQKICHGRIDVFLQTVELDYLISTGFAGALDPELRVGDLLVSENFSSPELLQLPQIKRAEHGFSSGKLVTAPRIIASETDRKRYATETGARAIDMETACIAAACEEHRIPMLSLRVISDTASEPFPAPPEVLFDLQRQRTNIARLALYLATHPTAFRRLAVFRRQIDSARRSLTTTLDKLLYV